jgi:hypothetical protein
MNKQLRKYHFQIWRIFALVIPVAFTLGLLLRPTSIKKRIQSNEFNFNLELKREQSVLEIQLINPLQSASCLVYALPRSGEKIFLGAINRQGKYAFSCPYKITGILLFDLIRNKEILTHYFKDEELP